MGTLITRFAPLAVVVCAGLGLWALSGSQAQAQDDLKQIELNDKLVIVFHYRTEGFRAAVQQACRRRRQARRALTAQLEDIAKKNGFASFAEFEDVGANITIVLDGLDRTSGTYTDPSEKMKKELEEIKADDYHSGRGQEARRRRPDAGNRLRPAA